MHKQVDQQFLVVVASARAKGQGDRAQGTGPNARLQLPLGIVGIFANALIYLSITIKYVFIYLLHLFMNSCSWLLSLFISFIFDIYYYLFVLLLVLRSSFFVGCILGGSLFVRTPYLRLQGRIQFFERLSKRSSYSLGNRWIGCALTCSFG